MLLTGSYERSLDEKHRLPLPKRFREALGLEAQTLFLTPGTDGSLSLYSGPAFARMADKLATQSPTAHDVRTFGRLLYAQSQSVQLDRQGRFRVPPELARLAELDREVVMLGVGDHVELWNKSRWENYLSREQPRYDQLAESAFRGALGSGNVASESPRAAIPSAPRETPSQPR